MHSHINTILCMALMQEQSGTLFVIRSFHIPEAGDEGVFVRKRGETREIGWLFFFGREMKDYFEATPECLRMGLFF